MAESRPQIKEEILLRVKWLYAFFIFVGLLLSLRIVYVMFFSQEISDNAERLERRIIQSEEIPAMRGSILARNGEPLATSMFRYQPMMDFSSIGFDSLQLFNENVDSLSKLLSLYFRDRSAKEYSDLFKRKRMESYQVVNHRDTLIPRSEGWLTQAFNRLFNREFVTRRIADTLRQDSILFPIFPRSVDYYEWQTLKKYPILKYDMGYTYKLDERDERIYTQGDLALRTIGKSNDRGKRFGIEDIYSKELAGTNGEVKRQRIARGFYRRIPGSDDVAPIDGVDVVTTLDIDLQDVAHKALYSQLEAQNAFWGTSIVMEVATGDILALVNLGAGKSGGFYEDFEYAFKKRMEPGSTLKLAALMALIEVGGKSLSLEYDSGDGKVVEVGNAKVQDSHRGLKVIDMKKATAESSNVFFARAVFDTFRDNPQLYTDYLSSLNLDKRVGLESFGEVAPIFPTPGSKIWYKDMTLPNIGYGYGLEITPIQTLTLYNAVANGGRMVAPRLISEFRRGREVVESVPTRTINEQICSEHTLALVRECLEEVAKSGTAKYYFGDTTRYCVGAKTGTAKIAQDGHTYNDGYYLGSMVTYMPADKPKYTIMTAIYTRRGRGTTIYGAGLADPVQKQIADYIYNREEEWHRKVASDGTTHHPTNIKGGDIEQMRRVADDLSPRTTYDRREGWGEISIDSMSNAKIESIVTARGVVPNVHGMGLKEALFLLESAGLKVSFTGRGAVTKQSLKAGTRCNEGDRIEILLK